ncbi:flagellar biosynthesis protein FliQ [Mobilitalea sibirica]|uniref:Flagellar biosynthetic protein FliQ n=1 Tax=Mobilitalea sibirica TaxID=1462919 RepID=A0A8J7H4R5_9FIRM|nr:flagellar biosynthesis protein FliQ [Mobilitalea sibirica]
MNEIIVIDIAKQAVYLMLKVAAPMLITSLVVGLVLSVLQTVTSIQEQTLTFVPKLVAVFVVMMLFGNWILTSLREFMVELFSNFSYYINAL